MHTTLRSLVLLLLWSCSSSTQHQVRMPTTASSLGSDTETGQLQLVFSRVATNVVVAIDGSLVVERSEAKGILILGVESGYVNVSIAADGVERSARVWIDAGRVTSVPIGNAGSPERMNPVVTTALSIVAFLISRAATDLLF
jgi:hypothetical protein